MDRNETLNDPETAMRYSLEGKQAQMRTAMPAIVTAVDYNKMTLECQPAILGIQENPDNSFTSVKLPLLVDVPIMFPSAGGFILSLPIKVGDEVLAIISDRCIDGWWYSGVLSPPLELRMHDLSDGFALPGPKSLIKAALVAGGVSNTNAELRTNDGLTKISMTPLGAINMVAPLGVTITGNLAVTGNVAATGGVSGATVVAPLMTVGGKPLLTHTHPVTTAPGTTGTMT